MDSHLSGIRIFQYPPPYSVDSEQTLDGFLHDSPLPTPPAQALDNLLNTSVVPSEPNLDDLLNFSDVHSGSALLLDALPRVDDEKGTLRSSPANVVSEGPWFSRGGTEGPASGWPDWPSGGDSKPSTSRWSGTRSSGGDVKFSVLGRSESWLLQDETETKASPLGAGLANLGNTCFLNAIIQCLTHMVPLIQGLRSYDHLSTSGCDGDGFCIFCCLLELVEHSLDSSDRVVSPWKLVDNLSHISSSFRRFHQEDAHEFLQCFLDRLGSCSVYLKKKDMRLSSVYENLVKQVFGGRIISKLQCCSCGHCSDTYEPLIDLSLEIDEVDNLHGALESFTKVEKIEDFEIKFNCYKCKEEVSVKKQLILDQAPSIATFHLKRFKNDGFYAEKIHKFVEFPLELDLLPYTDSNQNNNASVELKYYLYAIVVHAGFTLTSGHYFSFIRSAPDAWYELDDSKVTRVQEDLVLSQQAYILFYAKKDTPWFSSFMDVEKSADANLTNSSPKSVLDNVEHICSSPPYLANNYSFEVDEAKKDAVRVPVVFFNGSRHDDEVNVPTDVSHRLTTSVPQGMSNSSVGMICTVENKTLTYGFGDSNCNQEIFEVKNGSSIIPSTPSSLTLNLYVEEPPVVSNSILWQHLQSEKLVSCKRQMDEDIEDSDRKEARKLMKKMLQ